MHGNTSDMGDTSEPADPNVTATLWQRAPGGAWLDGGGQGGFMAVSPAVDCPRSPNLTSSLASATYECPAAVWDGTEHSVPATLSPMSCLSAHVLSRSVRAMQVFGPYLFLGGSFLGHTTNAYSYIVQWDGAKVQPLGGGLDGTVYALDVFRGQLVVGGSFSQLYQVSFSRMHAATLDTSFGNDVNTRTHTHTQREREKQTDLQRAERGTEREPLAPSVHWRLSRESQISFTYALRLTCAACR